MKHKKEVFGIMKKDEEDSIVLAYRVIKQDIKRCILYDSGEVPSRSFVRQFIDCMKAEFSDGDSSGKDITGAEVTIPGSKYASYWTCYGLHNANAGEHNDDYGILIGTSDIAPSNSDYAMGSQIIDGSGVGELNYGEMSFYDLLEEAGYVELTMTRTFYNAGSDNVTVKEIGLAVYHYFAEKYFLWIRDVLDTPVTVEPAQTLTVQYIIKTKA